MENYDGEFHRKVKFGLVDGKLKPIYAEQTLTDMESGETMRYDSSMDDLLLQKLLKKYSAWFRKLFSATRFNYIDMIQKERDQQRSIQ